MILLQIEACVWASNPKGLNKHWSLKVESIDHLDFLKVHTILSNKNVRTYRF